MGSSSPNETKKERTENNDSLSNMTNSKKLEQNNQNVASNQNQNSNSKQHSKVNKNSGTNQNITSNQNQSSNPNQNSNIDSNDNLNENDQENSDLNLIPKKIKSIKRIDPYADVEQETPEEKNKKKLIEVIKNDDYDDKNNECHEYMFFPMKEGKQKQQNIEPLLKKSKKKKKMYNFSKENDKKKEKDLAKILHINYDIDNPKFPYSIKKLKCDKKVGDNFLVIEYNMHKTGDKNELVSRTVHTNYKNAELDNYEYTNHNGERYDFLDINNDTNEIRRLKLMEENNLNNINNISNDEDDDELKKVEEKEENEDRYINKYKKGQFTIRKII